MDAAILGKIPGTLTKMRAEMQTDLRREVHLFLSHGYGFRGKGVANPSHTGRGLGVLGSEVMKTIVSFFIGLGRTKYIIQGWGRRYDEVCQVHGEFFKGILMERDALFGTASYLDDRRGVVVCGDGFEFPASESRGGLESWRNINWWKLISELPPYTVICGNRGLLWGLDMSKRLKTTSSAFILDARRRKVYRIAYMGAWTGNAMPVLCRFFPEITVPRNKIMGGS